MFAKVTARHEGTLINSILGVLCRRHGFTAEIYGHVNDLLTDRPRWDVGLSWPCRLIVSGQSNDKTVCHQDAV